MKENNGVYICTGQDLNDMSSGITKKILKQIKTMEEVGYNIRLINFDNKSNTNVIDSLKFLFPIILSKYEKQMVQWVSKIEWKKIEFVYIRKITFSKGFCQMISFIRSSNPSIKIFMEIPTYPLNGEYTGVKRVLRIITNYYSKKMKNFINYIVTYSSDKMIWGIKTINISNSVDFSKVLQKKPSGLNSIDMIAVATISKWHGYDRVIKGLHEYYKNGGNRKIYFHVVGEGAELKNYKKLVDKYNLNNYVIFYGRLSGNKLDEVYDKCNIAIDAMGRHRSKVFYNSSLKGKEYGARGLPIISGVETELDAYSDYKYYLRIPSNDSDLSMKTVIDFYDFVYKDNNVDISKEIRDFNISKFDFSIAFKPVIDLISKESNYEN